MNTPKWLRIVAAVLVALAAGTRRVSRRSTRNLPAGAPGRPLELGR
jgi:hypothetical protein